LASWSCFAETDGRRGNGPRLKSTAFQEWPVALECANQALEGRSRKDDACELELSHGANDPFLENGG